MGFCLLRREGDVLYIVVPEVFPTRQFALSHLKALLEEGAVEYGELLLVDLDDVSPVLVIERAFALTPEVATPVAPEFVDEDPSVLLEEEPIAEAEIPVAEEHAATDVEVDESLVELPEEQEAISSEHEGEPADAVDALQEVEEPIASAVLADAEAEVLIDASEQPQESPGPDEEPEAPPSTTGESAEEEASGELLEEEIPDEALESERSEESQTVEEQQPEDIAEDLEAAAAEPVEQQQEPGEQPDVLGELEEVEELQEPEEAEMPPRAYEAGASDITLLTCDDCVYLNTCPKKGESDPASCGSFQWKSV